MSFICKVSGHKWPKLPDGTDGCTCERCGESHFAYGFKYGHNWVKQPGSCKATCSWCGREETRHDWDRCLCTWCGATCDDHSWEPVPGTCDFRCTVCGKVSQYKKNHMWKGCTCTCCGAVRNEGHAFAASPGGTSEVCSVCGKTLDESRAETAIEELKKAGRRHRDSPEAERLIAKISDVKSLMAIAPYAPFPTIRRLGALGADEALAAIARSTSYGYERRNDAKRLIRDEALRESIDVQRTEMEQRWYDYDIRSGM